VRQQIVGLPPFAWTAGAQQKPSAMAAMGAKRSQWPGRVRRLAFHRVKQAGIGLSRFLCIYASIAQKY
jgi:hypothetical protein